MRQAERSGKSCQRYCPRQPRQSPLWQFANRHLEEFEKVYLEKYASRYGPFRRIIAKELRKVLTCGDPRRGFVWIQCDHCSHQQLLGFSCKSRFCPSCHQRKVQTTARFALEQVTVPVAHRHLVLTIPKTFRPYFQRDRSLLKQLFAAAHQSITEYLHTVSDGPRGIPGTIMALHTFNADLDFNPHIHAILADGLFVQDGASKFVFLRFKERPKSLRLMELFRTKIIDLLIEKRLIADELKTRKLRGFTAYISDAVAPEAKDKLEKLLQYILRNSFSTQKITVDPDCDSVTYNSGWNHKIQSDFLKFEGTEFLAILTQHIPEKNSQTIRYYGFYSNKMRGRRLRKAPGGVAFGRPTAPLVSPAHQSGKLWRDLIQRVWHADPLLCPRCSEPMRIIAFIDDPSKVQDDPRVLDKFLGYLGAGHDPPQKSMWAVEA